MKANLVSLIIPCYNEQQNISKGTLKLVIDYVKQNDVFKELIVVDDGSLDQSVSLIKQSFPPGDKKFRLLQNQHGGKAQALLTGIASAQGEAVMFSDMDLATPISEAHRLIEAYQQNADIVIGSRESKREGAPLSRKILSLGMIVVRSLLFGLDNIHDTQCGFKLFNRKYALQIINNMRVFTKSHISKAPSVGAGFDLEFLHIAVKLGLKIKEVPVIWKHVETKRVNFIRDAYESLRDIAKIKWHSLMGDYDKH